MKAYICFWVVSCSVIFSDARTNAQQLEATPKVRRELQRIDSEEGTPLIIKLGEKTFPELEEILNDPKALPVEIYRSLYFISEINADRSRFLEHAVRRTADPNEQVRSRAARLLGKIGTSADASPLIALLSDKNEVVVNAAATALSAIGGSRELVALDAWTLGIAHADYPQLRAHVKKCRDALADRLVKKPK